MIILIIHNKKIIYNTIHYETAAIGKNDRRFILCVLSRCFFVFSSKSNSSYRTVNNLQTFLAPRIHCNHHFLLFSSTL